MRKCTIDGAAMLTRADAHAQLARALELPEYYGANLDALWDCVSAMDAELTLVHPAPMLDALKVYGCKLLETLCEAAESNAHFQFHVNDGDSPHPLPVY